MATVVWLNGTFGAGKTTTAKELVPLLRNARVFDPEQVGFMLQVCLADRPVDDFQEWPAWRELVASTADSIIRQTGQQLVATQTVLAERHWAHLVAGLVRAGHDVFHVLLTADEDTLRRRITSDEAESERARAWRLRHLAEYAGTEPWMSAAADLVLDTTSRTPAEAASAIAAAVSVIRPVPR